MTTIPFAEALKLLDRAYDIHVPGHDNTVSFSLDTAEGAAAFLEVTTEENDNEFFFRFLESANQTVKIDGDLMTLVYDTAVADDLPPEIDILLMVPMDLEPEVAAEAGPLQEHDQQDDPKDDADDLQRQGGEEFTEQPVDDTKDKGENKNGQECGKQHVAPYQVPEAVTRDSFGIPPLVLKALRHVRAHIPEVDRVVFWGATRWAFMTPEHATPSFRGRRVDISLLEDAAAEVGDGRPHAFQLPPEEL